MLSMSPVAASESEMSNRTYKIDDLILLMSRLRDPQTGCPWDLEQDFHSLAPYMLEEAYEVVDTLERNDFAHFPEELGDLLFQVVFHSQVASEKALFDFEHVVHVLTKKLIQRHPHVFPDGTLESKRDNLAKIVDTDVSVAWETKKQQERENKGFRGALSDIPVGFPALTRAQKVQKRAAKVGFDWEGIAPVLDKVHEELSELGEELDVGDKERLADEMGDILFSVVNLARHLHLDAESCLRASTRKFERRFSRMEEVVAEEGSSLEKLNNDELDQLWEIAKRIVKF